MKKIGLITSLLGVVTLSPALIPLTSCSCSIIHINKDEHIKSIDCSTIKKNESFTITVTCEDGYALDTITIKINDKELTSDQYTISGNVVTVKAEAVTDNNNIYISATSKAK